MIPLTDSIVLSNPLRWDNISITHPLKLSSTVITTYSIGSCLRPFSIRIITCGADTWISNHSLLMVSIKTDKCSSHLPDTGYLCPCHISTRNHTFVSHSFSSLSAIFLDVTFFHDLHANGESFTRKSIVNVGSSIVIAGIGSTVSSPAIVSHTKISEIPAIVQTSPLTATSVSIL